MKAFYIRRVLRIFPAFYVFIVFATLLAGIGFATIDRRDVIYAVTYTMNYHANYSENFSLRHLWSLAVEEQFYLLWPLTLAILMPLRATRVLVGVVLVVPILRVALYRFMPGYENIADTGFEGVCDALATGCLLAIAMPRLVRMDSFNRFVLGPLFPVLFAAVFVANKQRDHPKFFWLLCVPFMNVTLALTVLRYVEAPFLPLGRLLNRQPLVSIGVLSYSLYLWQQLLLIQSRPVTSMFVEHPDGVRVRRRLLSPRRNAISPSEAALRIGADARRPAVRPAARPAVGAASFRRVRRIVSRRGRRCHRVGI